MTKKGTHPVLVYRGSSLHSPCCCSRPQVCTAKLFGWSTTATCAWRGLWFGALAQQFCFWTWGLFLRGSTNQRWKQHWSTWTKMARLATKEMARLWRGHSPLATIISLFWLFSNTNGFPFFKHVASVVWSFGVWSLLSWDCIHLDLHPKSLSTNGTSSMTNPSFLTRLGFYPSLKPGLPSVNFKINRFNLECHKPHDAGPSQGRPVSKLGRLRDRWSLGWCWTLVCL